MRPCWFLPWPRAGWGLWGVVAVGNAAAGLFGGLYGGVLCILISGAVTPVINMPPFLQYASQLNPMRHFTAIVQGVFLKDITCAAAVNLGKIACISAVAVSVAVWMFKRKA